MLSLSSGGLPFSRPIRRRSRWPFLSSTAGVLLIAFLVPETSLATDRHWSGGSNTTWGTSGNWDTTPPGGTTDNAVFNGAFSNQPNLTSTATAGGLWMTTGVGQSVTISGTTLTLQGNTINGTAGLGVLMDNTSAYTLTINAPLKLGAAQTWRNNSTNLLTIGGAVDTNNKALTIDGTGNATISGVITSGNASGTVTKSGAGTLILSGNNTYLGTSTVSAGILNIQNANALGATSAGTIVSSGASLQLQGGITFAAEGLTISGTGATGQNGALVNASGTNNYAGLLTLGAAATISSDSGTLNLTNAGTITGATFGLTLTGAGDGSISSIIGTTSGTLTKAGTGTWTLSGVNTYTGSTTVNAGTLKVGVASALPSSAVTVSGTGAGTTATLDLNGFNDTIASLTLGGSTATSSAAVTTGAGTLTLNGNVTYDATNNPLGATISGKLSLGSATRTFTVGDSSNAAADLSMSAVISGVFLGITKAGSGVLALSGANTYSGTTTVSAGVLNIQSNAGLGSTFVGTVVSSGATLQLQGGITVGAETLTISGTGASGQNGALVNVSGTNNYGGLLTLGAAAVVSSDNGTLNLTNAGTITGATFGLTLTGAGAGSISSIIGTTSGSLIKNGAGTWTLSGANTYTGGSTINAGTLVVSSDANLGGAAGGLTLNAGILEIATGFSTTRLASLGDTTSTFQVDASQTYTVNGVISGTGTLNKTGAGTMVLGGINIYSGGTNVNAGTLQLSVVNQLLNTGAINISGGTFDLQTFNQTVGAVTLSSGTIAGSTGVLTGSSFSLQSGTVSAIISGVGTVTKSTSGTVTLSGANTYTGATTISAGTLQINTNGALGTTLNGTTVTSGAALKLNGVNYSTAEGLTLNGTGISGAGALTNSGTSTFGGAINIASNATISPGGGTLNLTGGISKNGATLTFAGGGTVNIMTNGITGSSPNSDLVVDGTTVVLSAPNSYNGPTTIQNSGTIQLGANNVFPTSPQTALTINTSSMLDMASYSDSVASLTGDSSAIVKNSVASTTSTLTVNPSSGSTTFAGVIAGTNGGAQGNIALTKTGAGTLVLSGVNTYTGATTINAGTLDVTGSLASGSAVTVNNSGTVLEGTGTIYGSVNIASSGAILEAGTGSTGQTLTMRGAVTMGAGSILAIALGASITHSTLAIGVGGSISFQSLQKFNIIDLGVTGGSTYTGLITGIGSNPGTESGWTISNQSWAYNFSYDAANGGEIDLTVTAAPEPSTYLVGALALAALIYNQRRRILRLAPSSKIL